MNYYDTFNSIGIICVLTVVVMAWAFIKTFF